MVAPMPEERARCEQYPLGVQQALREALDRLVAEQLGEPDRAARWTHPSDAAGLALEEGVEQIAVGVDDRARPGKDDVAPTHGDQREDLGRRRRADRQVVLEPGARLEE